MIPFLHETYTTFIAPLILPSLPSSPASQNWNIFKFIYSAIICFSEPLQGSNDCQTPFSLCKLRLDWNHLLQNMLSSTSPKNSTYYFFVINSKYNEENAYLVFQDNIIRCHSQKSWLSNQDYLNYSSKQTGIWVVNF